MTRKTWIFCVVVSAGVLLLAYTLLSTRAVVAQELMRALVVNLESPHPIEGRVSVGGTIQHAVTVPIKDVVVSTAQRDDVAAWIDAGVVETGGFTSLVLSLQGQMRGSVPRAGSIGVVLIPDEEPILQALSEGVAQLFLETAAEVVPGADYFTGVQASLPIGFPRYRVFLYNTAGQGAVANVYLYLTN